MDIADLGYRSHVTAPRVRSCPCWEREATLWITLGLAFFQARLCPRCPSWILSSLRLLALRACLCPLANRAGHIKHWRPGCLSAPLQSVWRSRSRSCLKWALRGGSQYFWGLPCYAWALHRTWILTGYTGIALWLGFSESSGLFCQFTSLTLGRLSSGLFY